MWGDDRHFPLRGYCWCTNGASLPFLPSECPDSTGVHWAWRSSLSRFARVLSPLANQRISGESWISLSDVRSQDGKSAISAVLWTMQGYRWFLLGWRGFCHISAEHALLPFFSEQYFTLMLLHLQILFLASFIPVSPAVLPWLLWITNCFICSDCRKHKSGVWYE